MSLTKCCWKEQGLTFGAHGVKLPCACGTAGSWLKGSKVTGVKGHQFNERKAKIREQKQDEQLRRYHNDILARLVLRMVVMKMMMTTMK